MPASYEDDDQLMAGAGSGSVTGFGSGSFPSRCSRAMTAAASACVVSACVVRWGGQGRQVWNYLTCRSTNRSTVAAPMSAHPVTVRNIAESIGTTERPKLSMSR